MHGRQTNTAFRFVFPVVHWDAIQAVTDVMNIAALSLRLTGNIDNAKRQVPIEYKSRQTAVRNQTYGSLTDRPCDVQTFKQTNDDRWFQWEDKRFYSETHCTRAYYCQFACHSSVTLLISCQNGSLNIHRVTKK